MADPDNVSLHDERQFVHWRDDVMGVAEPEAVVRRFAPSLRREIRRLLRKSSRLQDLLNVYPGLLAALAMRRGDEAQRRLALSLIDDGAALKDVARALEMPMWMRRLGPEAYDLGLPANLPKSERFGRRIAARIPAASEQSAMWLAFVLFAERAVGDDFAVWMAEQRIAYDRGSAEDLLAVLAAYAWFSSARDTEAYKLIGAPWRPEIAFETALCAAKSWLNRLRLTTQLGAGAISDSWLQPGAAHGYSFEPLLDDAQIFAEASAMQNCADQYAERIARHRSRLFSIRRDSVRAATLEISHHPRETGFYAIMQLKARHNMAALPDVWNAAYAWMASQPNLRCPSPLLSLAAAPPFDQKRWREMMAPYRAAVGGAPWIKAEADEAMFVRYNADMADVARRAGVTSWLFT